MTSTPQHQAWSPWRTVVAFGVVSLLADLVYEGARSITGPLLASLGASAFVVGVVTGAGEAAALVLRLFFGALADRTGRYWSLTIIGYGLTAVSVPLLALTPFLGGAGLGVACLLILAERTGKAVRSPSKSALLAIAAHEVGRGRGFGVHKALDQVGAFAGPLVVAATVSITAAIWPALAILAVPGAAAMIVLIIVRSHLSVPAKAGADAEASSPTAADILASHRLPPSFFRFATASGLATAGLVSFGLIGFHLVDDELMSVGGVPMVYALAMGCAAIAALATGWAYDRWGAGVLLALPILVSAVPALVFAAQLSAVLVGVAVWGLAMGLQDSTVKALVADLVPRERLAGAYGTFAAVQGGAAILGGAAAGFLYSRSLPTLVAVIAVLQVVSLALLVSVGRSAARTR